MSVDALERITNGANTLGFTAWVSVALPVVLMANLVVFGIVVAALRPFDMHQIPPIVYK